MHLSIHIEKKGIVSVRSATLCNSEAVRVGFFETSAEVGEKPIQVRPVFLGQSELAVLASDDMLLHKSIWFPTRK